MRPPDCPRETAAELLRDAPPTDSPSTRLNRSIPRSRKLKSTARGDHSGWSPHAELRLELLALPCAEQLVGWVEDRLR